MPPNPPREAMEAEARASEEMMADEPSETTPASRVYRLREIRYRLQFKLFSTLTEDEKQQVGPKLQAMTEANEADVSPPGGWVDGVQAQYDTLLAFLDGQLLAALVIRSVPVLDPMVIRADLQGSIRSEVFISTVRRAEGIVQQMGAAAYFFGVSPYVMDDFCNLLAGQEGTDEWKRDRVKFFRRLL